MSHSLSHPVTQWLSHSVLLLMIVACVVEVQAQQRQVVTIGIVTDGAYQRHADLLDQTRQEVTQLLATDRDVRFPADKTVAGDFTLAGVTAAVDQLLSDPAVDLVITLGPISSHIISTRGPLPKPVVATLIVDAELQGLPQQGGASGVTNLSYLVAVHNERNLVSLQEVVPFSRVAVLLNAAILDALPDLGDRLSVAALELDFTFQLVPVGASVDDALSAIESDVDAVYVLPLSQLSSGEVERLIQGLNDRNLPSFSWLGPEEVERGVLATRMPGTFFSQIVRRIALNVQRILLGAEAGTLSVAFTAQERLAINMRTARAIQAYPTWKILTEATLIGEMAPPAERQLSLASAVREAVTANLDLAAQDRAVAAGEQEIRLATSPLLPQIQLAAEGSIIDDDRAAASFGILPERQLTGSVTATQILFDEPLWANRSVQQSVQQARVEDRETLRLDIVQSAAVTYLNVLRAKTFERILRSNLSVTRSNLELAQLRRTVGTASPGEVYRWESQIANNRQDVIDATAGVRLAEIQLNRLLHRRLEETFDTDEVDLTDPVLLSSQDRLYGYIDNPWSFEVFREFMAEEAVQASPELRALNALTTAQQRALSSARRAFWTPTIALQAGLENVFASGGAGSSSEPPVAGLTSLNDLRWSVGFRVSYPLFTGAARFATRNRATEELARIETERQAIEERIEQRLRSNLLDMGASLANIELSRDAATAARNNFNLVRDNYSRGIGSILDLLDAQNQALIADESAANAVYDFLIDFMNVQRAVGRFDFSATEEDREAFFQRLETFFENAGAPVRR